MRRRDFITGAAALAAYGALKPAEALTPQQRATILGGVSKWRVPGLMVSAGDSVTGRQTTPAFNFFGPDYANLLPWFSNGKVINIYNGGIAGQTSAQILARIPSLLLKLPNGGFLLTMMGTNDVAQSVALTTTQANFASAADLCKAAGVVPVFVTIPPRGNVAIGLIGGLTATPSASGGTLAAGTYNYQVTGVNSSGETLPSASVPAVVTGSTGAVACAWTPKASVSAYKLYRDGLLLATIANDATGATWGKVTYTDTGAVTPSGAVPSSDTTGNVSTAPFIAATNAINNWLVPWCAQNHYPCIDLRSVMADPVTGFYPSATSWDGVHPIGPMERMMASAGWQQIAPYVQQAHNYLATSESDPGNLVANSQFSANNGSLPTSWSKSGGTTTNTITTLAGILGKVLSVTPLDPLAQTSITSPNITTGFSDGDTLFAGFKCQISGNEAAGARPQIGFRAVSTSYWACCFAAAGVDTDGVVEVNAEFTIPAGQGITAFRFEIDSGIVGAGETIIVGQLTLRNLTTGGLIIP